MAVVAEFGKKSAKALQALAADATPSAGRDCVIELEQAGDSAKAAAEADADAAAATREAVGDAHLAVCILKAETS